MIDIVASGVLFDMDGTLVDSTAIVEATWTRFGLAHGLDPAEILAFSHGRQAIDTIQRFLPDLSADEQQRAADHLVDEEATQADAVVEIPGAAGFVERLLAIGVPVALVTSAPRDLAVERMAAAGVPLPAAFVPSEDAARGKPHPDGYLRGAEMLGVPASDCVAFEDAPAGLQAAIASGVTTVVVGPLEDPVTVGLQRVHGFDGVEVTREGPAFRIRG